MSLQHPRTSSVENWKPKRIDDFTYLGSLISSDNRAHKDIMARLNMARVAFMPATP